MRVSWNGISIDLFKAFARIDFSKTMIARPRFYVSALTFCFAFFSLFLIVFSPSFLNLWSLMAFSPLCKNAFFIIPIILFRTSSLLGFLPHAQGGIWLFDLGVHIFFTSIRLENVMFFPYLFICFALALSNSLYFLSEILICFPLTIAIYL